MPIIPTIGDVSRKDPISQQLIPINYYSNDARGAVELKEWECVEVGHHKDVGKTIEEWQKNGWRLHTYQATAYRTDVNHYLLFEKGE